jgi:Raf kinase inhibitor-like YbhB/YbcL family protein
MKKICLSILLASQFLMADAQTFTLTSSDLGGQFTMQQVFDGCGGKNISPQLSWANAPKGTKSFAILIHDESAPTGSGWWHWLVFDIPISTNNLPSNAGAKNSLLLPKQAIQSLTDFGFSGFGGPCPPVGHGFHKYTITVYALKVDKLGLDANTNAAKVGFTINANTIEKASIVAYYQR